MPTVQAIESALFALAPRELAMDWDNVGLLLGDPAAEVTYALLALDVTDAVAAEAKAKGCQLIVSHHPLMNGPLAPAGDADPAAGPPSGPSPHNTHQG